MKLTGKQIEQVRNALLSGYPAKTDLRMLVRIELDENLETIADGENLRVVVFNLVSWAEQTGRLDAVIQGAYRQNPGNPALKQLVQDAAGWGAPAPHTSGKTYRTGVH
ncbi:MAG: hypothetical protein IPK16_08335 [Anaerolineales bacterium]|nr:hypothetical protein [Anaerolineales bacterium]